MFTTNWKKVFDKEVIDSIEQDSWLPKPSGGDSSPNSAFVLSIICEIRYYFMFSKDIFKYIAYKVVLQLFLLVKKLHILV
jgi:hypothetical protein